MTWLSFGPRTEHPGALRVDVLPIADAIADIRHLWRYGDGAFEGIEAFHILEHLLPDEAPRALAECFRVLQAGGVLEVAVPDMEKCARTLLKGDLEVLKNIYSPSDVLPLQHRWGYTRKSFEALLAAAGFVQFRWLPGHPSDPHEMRARVCKP